MNRHQTRHTVGNRASIIDALPTTVAAAIYPPTERRVIQSPEWAGPDPVVGFIDKNVLTLRTKQIGNVWPHNLKMNLAFQTNRNQILWRVGIQGKPTDKNSTRE